MKGQSLSFSCDLLQGYGGRAMLSGLHSVLRFRFPAHPLIGSTLAGALSAAAVFHFYWAGGGDWGLRQSLGVGSEARVAAWIRLASATVGAALLAASGLSLARASVWRPPLPEWVVHKGAWTLAGVLLFVGLLNLTARTAFERTAIAPTVLSLAALALIAASSKHASTEDTEERGADSDASRLDLV